MNDKFQIGDLVEISNKYASLYPETSGFLGIITDFGEKGQPELDPRLSFWVHFATGDEKRVWAFYLRKATK